MEAPEIELITEFLRKRLIGKSISELYLQDAKRIVKNSSQEELSEQLTGKVFRSVTRHGKYILFEFIGEERMLTHLMLTGYWKYFESINTQWPKYIRASFLLNHGCLLLSDRRGFSILKYYKPQQKIKEIDRIKIDALNDKADPEYLYNKFHKHKKKYTVQHALLNQLVITGIGNIYSNEVCFEAELNPFKPANSITKKECKKLSFAIYKTMNLAYKFGGCKYVQKHSINEVELETLQSYLCKVYGQEGEECTKCNATIEKRETYKLTYFCPQCQSVAKKKRYSSHDAIKNDLNWLR